MPSMPEQLAAAAKAHFDAQFQLIQTLTTKTLEGAEKIIALNVNAAKSSVQDTADAARAATSASDAQTFASTSAAQLQPNTDKVLAYGRELTEIGQSMQAEFAKVTEAQVRDTRDKLAALVDEAAKNAPAGSEATVAMMQSILSSADALYAQMMESSKHAVDSLQSSVKAATDNLTQATENATKAGKPQ